MIKNVVSQKILLSDEDFKKYKTNNRVWFSILTILLVSIITVIAVSILNKELELGIYTGSLLAFYLVSLGIVASKNKANWILWVLLTLISMFIIPLVGMIVSHILIARKGFKNEWLSL